MNQMQTAIARVAFTGESWSPTVESWDQFEKRMLAAFDASLQSYRQHIMTAHAPLTMTAGAGYTRPV